MYILNDYCQQIDKSENHILKDNILINRRKAIMLYLRLNAVATAKASKNKETITTKCSKFDIQGIWKHIIIFMGESYVTLNSTYGSIENAGIMC